MTRPTMTTKALETTATGHLVEFLCDDGVTDEVAVCAPHGGHIEPGTAEQAVELAARLPDATCWGCFGHDTDGDAFDRFHRPSTAVDPEAFPLLDRIADRGFETVVSLHGLAAEGLLVGGAVDAETKRTVRRRLDSALAAEVETVSSGPYAGVSPQNFVNWLARGDAGGLQLEQGPTVRDEDAETVVAVLEDLVAVDRL